MVLGGCSWWAANGQAVTTDVLKEVGCVVSAAQQKQTVEQIALTCGIATVEDVVAILSSTQTPVTTSPALTGIMAAHPAMRVVVKN
jgi:hypothetical protein